LNQVCQSSVIVTVTVAEYVPVGKSDASNEELKTKQMSWFVKEKEDVEEAVSVVVVEVPLGTEMSPVFVLLPSA